MDYKDPVFTKFMNKIVGMTPFGFSLLIFNENKKDAYFDNYYGFNE